MLERAFVEREDGSVPRQYLGRLGVIAGMQGDRQEALEIYEELGAQRWGRPSKLAFWQAEIEAFLGELDKATALLREAVGQESAMVIHLQYPLLAQTLRDHPPFQELRRPKG